MYWANFLHIYQPPTQTNAILEKVVNESYRKIIAGMLDNPSAKLTINIPGVLTEMWAREGYIDLIENIRILLERDQLELTSTAKFHAFLPKLPESEIIRQINLNDETNRNFFGQLYKPQGFFPPEMAYSDKVGKVVRELGYKWIILDEIAIDPPVDYSKIHEDPQGLIFFFRERNMSFKILSSQLGTTDMLARELHDRLSQNLYLLTAMDGETFGHHRIGLDQMLIQIYRDERWKTVKVSDLIDKFPERKQLSPKPSNWALMPQDMKKGVYFARWDDPGNAVHQLQWNMVDYAFELDSKYGNEKSRDFLDISLHSDQFWWASAKPWWSLEMIERGAYEILQSIKSTDAPFESKEKAQKMYYEIITTGFNWQRNGIVESLSRQEDEELKAQLYEEKSEVTREDYDKLIELLIPQMKQAAENLEFIRAEQLRKRIEELKNERDKGYERKLDIAVNM
jgi:alpha-amylase/alpha-mannosidase (GH57 family)